MQIRTLVTELISRENRYLKAKEVSSLTGVGLFSLYREIPEGLELFQKKLGFERENLSLKHSYAELINKVRSLVNEVGRFMPGIEIAEALSISRSTFKKFGIDTSTLQEGFGYHRNGKKPPGGWNRGISNKVDIITKSDTSEIIIDKIISVIEKYGCYCPARVITEEIGIPESTLSFRGIRTELINNQLGYIRTNRFFEFSVFNALTEVFPNRDIVRQKWFLDCNSVDGNHLYFDSYIPDLKLAVEADGPCHYQETHPWFTDKVKERDSIKEEYCRQNGIHLLRIRYQNTVTKETILNHLSGTPLELYELQRSEKSQS